MRAADAPLSPRDQRGTMRWANIIPVTPPHCVRARNAGEQKETRPNDVSPAQLLLAPLMQTPPNPFTTTSSSRGGVSF